MKKIIFYWFPGTWEVDMLMHENPSATNLVGLGLWITDPRFPDRLPLNIYEPYMMCPPDYMASFGPIPAAGSSPFKALGAPSYEESVLKAVDVAVQQISRLPKDHPLVLGGYSQGAHVAELLMDEFNPGGRLRDRNLWAVYTFGNPARPAGVTFPNGNILPWGGITKLNVPVPQGCLYRSYAFHDDMYCNANPDSYLFDFYAALTDLQFHDPWKAVQDGILNLSKTDLMILFGAKPTSLAWIIANLPKFISISRKAANSIDAAARFVRSNAHSRYAEWEIIPGFTPVNHCIRSMKYLAKGKGYAVQGI